MNGFIKKIVRILLVIACLLIGTILYSKYIGTKGLSVKEYKITDKNISDNFHGIKMVHLSDFHYGITIGKKDLLKIVTKVNSLHPDIIVLTGDLFDKNIDLEEKEIDFIVSSLGKMNATMGKFAISGENDTGHKEWERTITDSGFINLNDSFDLLYKDDYTPLIISGISSNLKNKKNIQDKVSTSMKEIDTYNQTHVAPMYSILLMHEPDYVENIDTRYYNLIVAGHSHGGQIAIPILQQFFLPNGSKNYYNAHYKVAKSDLYISSGLGTTEMDYRFGSKPSINLYRLTNK